MSFRKLLEFLICILFPKRCVLCDEIIEFDKMFCENCKSGLPKSPLVRFISNYETDEVFKCISVFKYSGNARISILKFKFHGHKEYSDIFANLICDFLKSEEISDIDFICSVPISESRIKQRGYNQSELLSNSVGKILRIPVNNVIVKKRETLVQHELDLDARNKNLIGAFGVLSGEKIKDKNFIICDDIVTTGNTLKECAKTLKRYGANKIICCTVASCL